MVLQPDNRTIKRRYGKVDKIVLFFRCDEDLLRFEAKASPPLLRLNRKCPFCVFAFIETSLALQL